MIHIGGPSVRQQLLRRIAALQPDARPLWGKMTAHQMVCHLADSFRGVMGLKPISPATGLFQRTVMKWGALYLPVPWPKGVPTRPEMEQGVGGTPPGNFTRDRADLVHLMETFSDSSRRFEWTPHPIFGPLREREWLRWGYLHVDHHLRQFGL